MSTSIISKVRNLWRMVKQNGGIRNSLATVYRTDDLKWGTHVGTDRYGNKYYENNFYMYLRNRWVIFNENFHLEYDGSQIPPEWHMWMHYTSEHPPTVKPPVAYKWMVPHQENKSGTNEIYYPYSTTRVNMHSWMPSHLRGPDYAETPEKQFNVPENNQGGVQDTKNRIQPH